MTLLIGSLILNAILFYAFVKQCNRTDKAEYEAKLHKDDSQYWQNQFKQTMGLTVDASTNRSKVK